MGNGSQSGTRSDAASHGMWELRFFFCWLINSVLFIWFNVQLWNSVLLIGTIVTLLGIVHIVLLLILWVLSRLFTSIVGPIDRAQKTSRLVGGAVYFGTALAITWGLFPETHTPYALLGYGIQWSILTVVNYAVFSWLNEERADELSEMAGRLLSSTPMAVLGWLLGGSFSGFLLLYSALYTLLRLGFVIPIKYPIMLSVSIVAGASICIISVYAKGRRVSVVSTQIAAYALAMGYLGVADSHFLNHLAAVGEPSYAHSDSVETREQIDSWFPWMVLFFALFCFVGYLAVFQPPSDIFGIAIVGLYFLLALFFLVTTIDGIVHHFKQYHRWRKMWADCWNLLCLLSLSDDALATEYIYHILPEIEEVDLESTNEMTQIAESLLKKHNLEKHIPSETHTTATVYQSTPT